MPSPPSTFALYAFVLSLLSFVSLASCSVIPVDVSQRSQASEVTEPIEARQNFTLRGESRQLEKRFSNARFTFYDAGLGACGRVNTNSDFIVALNGAQWNGGAHCFETVTISYRGRTARATVMDLCPGCPYGGLDLTRGLFGYFANHDLGVIHGDWDFGGAAVQPAPPPPPPPRTSTPPPPPPPPPTSTRRPTPTPQAPPPPPPPTSTPRPPPTSTPRAAPPPPPTSPTSSSRPASTQSPAPTPSSPPALAPTGAADRIPDNVLNELNRAFSAIGILLANILQNPENRQQQ